MSFWAGIKEAIKDVDVIKEKEALAEERKAASDKAEAWQLKTFKYREDQDTILNDRAERKLKVEGDATAFDDLGSVTGLVLGAGGAPSKSGAPTPSGGGKGSTPSWAHSAAVAVSQHGASKDALATLMGHDLSSKALAKVVDSYAALKADAPNRIGGIPSFDEYILGTSVTFTEGQEVTDEMVTEALERIGKAPEETYGGATWFEIAKRRLVNAATQGQVTLETPVVADPLDMDDVEKAKDTATEDLANSIANQKASLTRQINEVQEAGGDTTDLATRLTKVSNDLERLEKPGGVTVDLIAEHGANAILPVLANARGWEVNSFGASWDAAIQGKTFTNNSEVVGAYRDGYLTDGDYYVVGTDILRANGKALTPAAYGPMASSRPQARPEELGEKVGTLPAGLGPQLPGSGEGPGAEDSKMPVVLPDDYYELLAFIAEQGLQVGTTVELGGKVVQLTPAVFDLANKKFGQTSTQSEGFSESPVDLDTEQTQLSNEGLQTTAPVGAERPVVEGIGDLAEPSILDKVTSALVEDKGAPLSSEEELAVGIEALVAGFLGQMDPADLESLTKELYIKHGEDTVREALAIAMSPGNQ